MSDATIAVPDLPKLADEDVKAVRSFLPGKLLGRTAALLSLVLMTLGFAAAVDRGLSRVLDVHLPMTPLERFGLLLGLPMSVVVAQSIAEWYAARARRRLKLLAITGKAVPQAYFRIGPYEDTAEDRRQFDRADGAHVKVLNWIRRAGGTVPLYLTGDSGSGKSSLLNSYVLPMLREDGWIVVAMRASQDPAIAIGAALASLVGETQVRDRPKPPTMQDLVEAVSGRGKRVLVVLDQFEEFLILGKPEQWRSFSELIDDLGGRPIAGFHLMLALRSDYQSLLDSSLGLPPLRHGENFYQVGRFTFGAAAGFLERSDLGLEALALDQLLVSASALDETPGLVRPITLNVLGFVLSTGQTVALSLDAGRLVRMYIEQTITQPAIRAFATPVLARLVTEQGTKQPRSEQDLVTETGLRRGEVRGVLNALATAALARPLDPSQGVWELSHDFVAGAVTRYLGRTRRGFQRFAGHYAAQILFAASLVVTGGVVVWNYDAWARTRGALAELGFSASRESSGLEVRVGSRNPFANSIFVTGRVGDAALKSAAPLIHDVVTLNIGGTTVSDLRPLASFPQLTELDLSNSAVRDFRPLEQLAGLTQLFIANCQISDIGSLAHLSRLKTVSFEYDTNLKDLSPLQNSTSLKRIDLLMSGVTDLSPLSKLSGLEYLQLWATEVRDLQPLRGLTSLIELDISHTKVVDLAPLSGMVALKHLFLEDTGVSDLTPLRELTALEWLALANTKVTDLTPVEFLPNLVEIDGISDAESNRLRIERAARGLPYKTAR